MANYVIPLAGAASADVAVVGGKAANLGALIGAGFDVPDGFVVTTEAFRAHFPTPPDDVEASRERLRSDGLGTDLLIALREAFDALIVRQDDPNVVIRSSSVNEDAEGASFAGQHATYYYVTRERLTRALVDCWLSLWSPEARSYRAAMGRPDADAMAVIVQRMIHAEASGVAFAEDPTGAHPGNLVIESTWGLGASIVDGRVAPDRFRITPDGTMHKTVSRKRVKVAENLVNGDGSRLDAVPSRLQMRPSIDARRVAEVADVTRRASKHFGTPQDVEWAVQDDTLYVLQSRPITGVGQARLEVAGQWIAFKPILENFDVPVTPLTADLARRVLPPAARFIGGRLYLDFATLKRMLPLRADDATLADLLLMKLDPTDAPFDRRQLPKLLLIAVLGYLAAGVFAARTRRLPVGVLDDFASYCDAVAADDRYDALALLRKLYEGPGPLAPVHRQMFQVNVSAVRYFFLIGLLRRLIRRFAPGVDAATLAAACTGSPRMWSARMVDALRDLAASAADDEALRGVLLEDDNPLATIAERFPDSGFLAAFERFLETFGHRCTREVELASPRWAEDPAPLLAMVRNYLKSDIPTTDHHAAIAAARDTLTQALPWRPLRWLARRLVGRISDYVTLRENSRHHHARVFGAVRRRVLLQEQNLIAAGRLRCADDIFFLKWHEVCALEAGTADWGDVESVIRGRRRAHEAASRVPAALAYNVELNRDPEGDTLTGQCASPGHALGRARIIRDPAVDADLEPGDVLVAPYTDPAWTPLFPAAAAIVVEVGSFLSHAGTIARELQIPCIVDVANCTRRIAPGDLVRVNATEGWVEIMEEE